MISVKKSQNHSIIWAPSRIGDIVAEMALCDVEGDVWNAFIGNLYRILAMRPFPAKRDSGRDGRRQTSGRHSAVSAVANPNSPTRSDLRSSMAPW